MNRLNVNKADVLLQIERDRLSDRERKVAVRLLMNYNVDSYTEF